MRGKRPLASDFARLAQAAPAGLVALVAVLDYP
jgi:hypothetical protein